MTLNQILYHYLKDFIDSIKTTYLTDKFAFTSFNAPNTMFDISNGLPDILLSLDHPTLKMYLKCLSLMKRNHEDTMAITITMNHHLFADVVSRSTYYKCRSKLLELELLIKTPKHSLMIVNPKYANKLFKPKFDLPTNL